MLEIISLAREIGYGITNGRMLDKKADLKLVLVAGHDKLENRLRTAWAGLTTQV